MKSSKRGQSILRKWTPQGKTFVFVVYLILFAILQMTFAWTTDIGASASNIQNFLAGSGIEGTVQVESLLMEGGEPRVIYHAGLLGMIFNSMFMLIGMAYIWFSRGEKR